MRAAGKRLEWLRHYLRSVGNIYTAGPCLTVAVEIYRYLRRVALKGYRTRPRPNIGWSKANRNRAASPGWYRPMARVGLTEVTRRRGARDRH